MRHLISGADCAIAGAATALAATPRPAAFKNSRRFIPYPPLDLYSGSPTVPHAQVYLGYGRNHGGASRLNPVCTGSTKVVNARSRENNGWKSRSRPIGRPRFKRAAMSFQLLAAVRIMKLS